MPLAGTIGIVTFVAACVPFIGAFVSGTFAVILTLGSQGTTDALIMIVIVLLANGLFQNILQPVAFGATLDLNPLAELVLTIGGGCLFGMVGMILAAPLASAAVHVSRDLALAREGGRAAERLGLEVAEAEDPRPVEGRARGGAGGFIPTGRLHRSPEGGLMAGTPRGPAGEDGGRRAARRSFTDGSTPAPGHGPP